MNPIQKNSDQEKSDNYFPHKFLLRVLHSYMVSCLKKNASFLLNSDDLNFRTDKPKESDHS